MTLLEWARAAVREMGKQKDAAERIGIPYATLQRILAGNSQLTFERLAKISAAASPSAQAELAEYLQQTGSIAGMIDPDVLAMSFGAIAPIAKTGIADKNLNYTGDQPSTSASPLQDRVAIAIPALGVKASAGDGSFLWGNEIGQGPFLFAEEWLRREFGSIPSLRLIQIQGDSQLPDLADGDWAIIDTSKSKLENGLAVVRLDDCLMIKRLQREGQFLQLISRNPIYAPTAIDLSKEEYRVTVIGRVVYIFKSA